MPRLPDHGSLIPIELAKVEECIQLGLRVTQRRLGAHECSATIATQPDSAFWLRGFYIEEPEGHR